MKNIDRMRKELILWHPWWNKLAVINWPMKKVYAIYMDCIHEDADKAFSKYTKKAFEAKTEEEQADIMFAYYERFNY